MADPLREFILLSILLVRGVAPDCGSLLVDPCNQGQSVAVEVCVLVGTSLTIACNVQDTAAAWLSPDFESTASISASVPMLTRLNDMVELKYINQTQTCVLSTATIDNVQSSLNGLDLFCGTHVPGRSAANISIGVIDDGIASVKQIVIDLTTDEKHVDLEFSIQDYQDCQFYKYLISEGSCSQQDDSTIIEILEPPTVQKTIDVNSFSKFSVSAYTEEEFCTCQEIDLDGFTVTPSQELLEETSYSILLSFSHNVHVLMESVRMSPHGKGANCDANNQTSKQVMLSCSDLSNSTTYSVTVEGNASLINSETGYQYTAFAVSLDFTTAAHMNNATVEENGWSNGYIAIIVLGIIIIVLSSILVIVLIVCVRHTKQKKGEADKQEEAKDLDNSGSSSKSFVLNTKSEGGKKENFQQFEQNTCGLEQFRKERGKLLAENVQLKRENRQIERETLRRKQAAAGEENEEQTNNYTDDESAQPDAPDAGGTGESNNFNYVSRCEVIYNYDGKQEYELTINPGDVIFVIEKRDDGWWQGNLEGTIGLFPASYAEEVEQY